MRITQCDRWRWLSVSTWSLMLMGILSSVPEVPQEVALSGQAVTSVFVTWRPPPGQVDGYKVRHLYCCISPFQVTSTEGQTGLKGCYAAVTSRWTCGMICVLAANDSKWSFFSLRGQMRPLTSGSVLTCWLLSNRRRHTTDSVTSSLKMYDPRRATARKNDQARRVHTENKSTFTENAHKCTHAQK